MKLTNCRGQATVEFTLAFILALVITWIPADFGLAFFTGQLAMSASREGARVVAAERNLGALPLNCAMPCGGANALLQIVSRRMSNALMPGAAIDITVDGGTSCSRQVHVRVAGNYNYFFYRILRFVGFASAGSPVNIVRQSNMRWEHQC